jgi:hypothetical protein
MKLSLFPNLVDLFSIGIALRNGYHLSKQGLSICFSKGLVSVIFDIIMRTTNGSVSGIKLLVNESLLAYNTLSGTFMKRKWILMSFIKCCCIAV